MADRSSVLPAQLLRRLITPAAFGALAGAIGAVFAMIRRRTREPTLPRMSDHWLRNLEHDSGCQMDHWRDRW